ncbi:hypothetical protein [Candidatus Lokiarchaeum ossiferum]|uniref:hypothetical protein n=1 Tax=Candidatus Lokiarchaeum ossiferum TaxID=2951803 RepID=UPI00352FAEC1
MAKNYLLIGLRITSIALLVLLIIQLGLIYNPEIFNFWNIMSIIGDLRDIFAYVMYIALYGIFTGISFGFSAVFSVLGAVFSADYFINFVNSVFSNMVGNWFYLPNYNPDTMVATPALLAPTLAESLSGLQFLFAEITEDLYMVLLQICIVIMFYHALRGTITSDPGQSIKVIVYINLIIIVPLFFRQIDIVLNMFSSFFAEMPEWYTNLIEKDLLQPEIFVDIKDLTFGGFLTSSIFLVATTMFVYLEFVFQLAYVDSVTTPSVERELRLNRQIDVMHTEAEKAISRIKAIEEMKREKKAQKRLNITEEDRQAQKEEEERLSLSALMSDKAESVGFSFIAELIAKKKAEKNEQVIMDAMKDTRRVAHYLEKLFKQDKEARNTLTAKAASPKASRLIASTLINMLTRIVLITAIMWVVVHPYNFFAFLKSPDAILKSVELQTVESTLSVLLPFLLIIPMISSVIRVTKHNKLKEMLRLEELQRAGLTEEELLALESSRGVVDESGVQMAQDADASASRA